MKRSKLAIFAFACFLMSHPAISGQKPTLSRLRVLTVNAWSGLDYQGFFKFGEYESAGRRAARFAALVQQVKALDPDVVFVQEANFAGRYAHRLAAALSLTEIHQVLNGGIKLGPIGLPVNFKEGVAILARPELRLRRHGVWKLSGPFGLYGDVVSFHFGEAVFSLVGKVLINETPLYLVNVHLAAGPPDEEDLFRQFRDRPEGREMAAQQFDQAISATKERTLRRQREVQQLLKALKSLPDDAPVIIAGDFNAEMRAPELQTFVASAGVLDTLTTARERTTAGRHERVSSWDAVLNENVAYSARNTDASGQPLHGLDLFNAMDASVSRRLDYIFLNGKFRSEDVKASGLAVQSDASGLHVSDHFGVFADVDLGPACKTSPQEPPTVVRPAGFTPEFLPIAMFDSDIGFGYGLKAFLLNPFRGSESFDIVLFNSTRGERWYQLAFSRPDIELRQGKIYPLAVDVTVDYDKMIRNNFFGVGNGSRFEDRAQYTREPIVVNLGLSRGFSLRTVGQVGLKYATITNAPIEGQNGSSALPSSLGLGRASSLSLYGNFRYDGRDSFIHPSEGLVFQAEVEYAPKISWTTVPWGRVAAWLQAYSILFYPKSVFALRLGGQSLFGENLPVQFLLPLGGSRTLRGSPQDRYLDKSHLLLNAEIRFPIVWRIGGVVGLDTGKVWPSLADVDFRDWVFNPTLGLRFTMKTFVVRLDVGFGKEATGFYFNFGHLF